MRIDPQKLRRTVEETARRLASDDAAGRIRAKVSATLTGDASAESRFVQYERPFVFASDEAVERGGRGEAPSPLRYFLSSVAFCQSVWYAKGAALVECALDGLEIDVETFLDMRGEHKVGEAPAHPQWLLLVARVASPSTPVRVLAMVDEANARCPVLNLVRRAVPIYERIVHNGTVIRDTAPAALGA